MTLAAMQTNRNDQPTPPMMTTVEEISPRRDTAFSKPRTGFAWSEAAANAAKRAERHMANAMTAHGAGDYRAALNAWRQCANETERLINAVEGQQRTPLGWQTIFAVYGDAARAALSLCEAEPEIDCLTQARAAVDKAAATVDAAGRKIGPDSDVMREGTAMKRILRAALAYCEYLADDGLESAARAARLRESLDRWQEVRAEAKVTGLASAGIDSLVESLRGRVAAAERHAREMEEVVGTMAAPLPPGWREHLTAEQQAWLASVETFRRQVGPVKFDAASLVRESRDAE